MKLSEGRANAAPSFLENAMTYEELYAIIDATKEAEARAKQLGFSLLKGNGAPPPSKPKYRGPNGEEWSGKGKRPGWIMQALAEGQSLEDFTV
jgi:DNA-binding protein H-NS